MKRLLGLALVAGVLAPLSGCGWYTNIPAQVRVKSIEPSAIGISAAVTAQAGSDKQAAAEKFFAYFFSKDVATKWSLGSGWPPLRSDIPASAVSSNPVVASLTPLAGTARPLLPGIANSADVLTAVDEATQKALTGGDPAELLKSASAAVQDSLDK